MRQRSSGSWELRVYVGTDPATKRRRYRTKTVRGNRATAERELAAMVEAAGLAPAVGARTTVAELLERWFVAASAGWSPTTVRSNRSILDRQLRPRIGGLLVAELTTARIDALYAELTREGGVGGKPLAVGTVKRTHVLLHAALAQAMRWGWVWDNPADHASPPRAVPSEIRAPSPDELAHLLRSVADHDPDLHAFLLLAVSTGARRAQLLGLRWADVDLHAGRVAFARGWVEGIGGPVLAPTKTKKAYRVDLDAATTAVLADHHRRVRERQSALPSTEAFVFGDGRGERPWLPNRVTKAFGRARRDAGLAHFRLHDLRHFMATRMLDAGVPLPVVSHRLGHARASTTLNVYAHAVPGGDRLAAETLWATLRRAGAKAPNLSFD